MALGSLISIPFWDRATAMAQNDNDDDIFYGSTVLSSHGYYTYRWIYFYPHVVGAILWWNLYFLQLFPTIRKRYPSFHRYLGRLLMLTTLAQTTSGAGLAVTAKTSTIKIVSIFLCIASFYVIYRDWSYARARDFVNDKYWAYRLVGYVQTIALQRFIYGHIVGITQNGIDILVSSH